MINAVCTIPSSSAEEKLYKPQSFLNDGINSNTTSLATTSTSPVRQSVVLTSLTDVNDILSLLFSQKLALEWEQFKSTVAYHLRAKEEDIEMLKSVLGAETGVVTACHFAKLLQWFWPLVPEVDNNGVSTSAWRVSSIAKLACQPWFHGFALDSNQKLRSCPSGTFLIKFGCQAPHFVLALKDRSTGSVVEWRVLSLGGKVKLTEGERFRDLHQLVENYTITVPIGASCLLESPFCNISK